MNNDVSPNPEFSPFGGPRPQSPQSPQPAATPAPPQPSPSPQPAATPAPPQPSPSPLTQSTPALPPQPLPIEPLKEKGDISLSKPKKPSWIKRHKKLSIILLIVLLVLLGGGGAAAYYFLVMNKPTETVETQATVQPEPPKPKYYSALTGAEVESREAAIATATAIMIENSPDARPQSGLKESGVIFEAIAEGGITRFMVLYQTEKPQLIGPVRSVRLYDVEWLRPFQAGLAHVGGSANALAEVRNGSYRDLDQFFNSGSYWRAADRYAPHNVYTSFERLDALNATKGYTDSAELIGFKRKDSKPADEADRTATSVAVTISSDLYNSTYAWNSTTNTYDRSQAGAPHLDREAGQISPRVLIVMEVMQQTVFEDGSREQITTIGNGKAHIFQDGTYTAATWNKTSASAQLTFTDAEGKELSLARGQTWLIAVPSGRGGVTWQ